MNSYADAVKILTSPKTFKISLGLERIEKIMELLGNPQDNLNCIHVAGTNGKGSVCAIIASILNEAGIKAGVYSSPHIFKYTERIKLSAKCHSEGQNFQIPRSALNDRKCCPEESNKLNSISDTDFAQYVFEISELADKNNINLTEFEILTAVMFKYFADNNADVVVLETGLGGRFDATNIIKKNLCSVITHIDYDHTERLGKTLDKIAFEKAGIIKPGCPCIVLEGREAFYDKAMEVGAELEIINPINNSFGTMGESQGQWLSLKGIYQQENLSLALAVIERCFPQINQDIIQKGLQNVKHPCRFEYIKDKNLIIDGAHNPNGIDGLMQSLDTYYPNTKRRFIFGCLRNKEYHKMINKICQNNNSEIYFYHFIHQNSAAFEELKAACPIPCKELTKDTKIDFNDGHLNIICGSFYMISELLDLLKITPDSL